MVSSPFLFRNHAEKADFGLPVIDEKKQCKPFLTANEVEQILERAKGRYKVLFALLQAGSNGAVGFTRKRASKRRWPKLFGTQVARFHATP
jgi:hypothetical protein